VADFQTFDNLRSSQLIQREIPLSKVTVEWNSTTEMFNKPGGLPRFPGAPEGVYLAYSNRVKDSPGVLPVKFAFAQQRTAPGLHLANPPDADPQVGYSESELRELGWERPGTYGPGLFSRGGHSHKSPQTVITPTLTNRPTATWMDPNNPPEGHLARLSHEGWKDTPNLGGRIYGTRALTWWPDMTWAETGETVPQGTHMSNNYYRAPDDWAGPMVPFPEGTTNTLMPSEASWDSLLKGGWYVGPDRWLITFGDHKVSGNKVYEMTMTLNFPELLSLDRPPYERGNAVALVPREDGYRKIYDRNGNLFQGKCWRSQAQSVTAGPDPSLGRDGEHWVVVPALRLFVEFGVPPDVGWIPSAASVGIPDGWQHSQYYGRHYRFSTHGLADMPDHQHGEYLATFALGHHYPMIPGMPDWIECMNAVSGWDRNHELGQNTVWNRGCEAVHMEFESGLVEGLPTMPWPEPVETWDGKPLSVKTSRARITIKATSSGGSTTQQTMLDARSE
jgi:hypothetical protein